MIWKISWKFDEDQSWFIWLASFGTWRTWRVPDWRLGYWGKGTLNLKKTLYLGISPNLRTPLPPFQSGTIVKKYYVLLVIIGFFYFLGCKSSPRVGILAKVPPPLGNYSQILHFFQTECSLIFYIISHVSRWLGRYLESLTKIWHDLDVGQIWDLEDVEGSWLETWRMGSSLTS